MVMKSPNSVKFKVPQRIWLREVTNMLRRSFLTCLFLPFKMYPLQLLLTLKWLGHSGKRYLNVDQIFMLLTLPPKMTKLSYL